MTMLSDNRKKQKRPDAVLKNTCPIRHTPVTKNGRVLIYQNVYSYARICSGWSRAYGRRNKINAAQP